MGEEESLPLMLREKEETRGDQQYHDTVTTIDDLPGDLLLWEILHRLHNPGDFFVCKSVCKYWNSLGSSPEFSFNPGFALIVNIPMLNEPTGDPHYATEGRAITHLRGFKLRYLPCFNRKYKSSGCVQSSCNDLLLCTKSYKEQKVFYIVNPLTAQWARLPKTPLEHSKVTFPVGLAVKVCGGSDDPIKFRYMVVRRTYTDDGWSRVEVFDSEICSWTVKFVGHPLGPWRPSHNQGLAFNGVLHWLLKNGPILAYDPFDPDQEIFRYIHRCEEMYHHYYETAIITECLTISQENLMVLQLVVFPADGFSGNQANHLCVWVLEDCDECTWRLYDRIYFRDMITDTPWIRYYMHEFAQRHTQYKMTETAKFRTWFRTYSLKYPENTEPIHMPEPLACHPHNKGLVYLHLPHTIVSCDLLTKRLKIISEMSTQLQSSRYDTVIPITFQLNPTPIPNFAIGNEGIKETNSKAENQGIIINNRFRFLDSLEE